jgi:hypothetical protein
MTKIPFISETAYWGLAKTTGFINVGDSGIGIEYQIRDNIIDIYRSQVKDVEIPYEIIQNIRFKKGWFFGGKLIIELNSIKNLGRIPLLEETEIKVKIRRKNRELARMFALTSQLELSTNKLNKLS